MGFIIWLIVGGVVGWLASLIMRTDAQQGIILNIVVGIVGAVIAGLIFGDGNINRRTARPDRTFLWSLLGAVILLAIVNLDSSAVRFAKRIAILKERAARDDPRGPFLSVY